MVEKRGKGRLKCIMQGKLLKDKRLEAIFAVGRLYFQVRIYTPMRM